MCFYEAERSENAGFTKRRQVIEQRCFDPLLDEAANAAEKALAA
jgi:hypothetical protein